MDIYVVRPGDTLYSVARGFGVSPRLLAGLNGAGLQTPLVVGQTLVVRYPSLVHVVAQGDTLPGIARRYGVDTRILWRNNLSLGGQGFLRAGEELVIEFADDSRLGAMRANGYAYPFIGGALLDSVLPYLTFLTPFTCGISADGSLLPLDDGALLSAARRYGAKALMHLSSLTEDGGFSSERALSLLESPDKQKALIREIEATLRAKGYYGLDVDFEFIPARARTLYADFIRSLREALGAQGYPVTVALAPKTRGDQPGLLYEAHDYALLGAAADSVLLMTYDKGW